MQTTLAQYNETQSSESFTLQNSKLLKVSLDCVSLYCASVVCMSTTTIPDRRRTGKAGSRTSTRKGCD